MVLVVVVEVVVVLVVVVITVIVIILIPILLIIIIVRRRRKGGMKNGDIYIPLHYINAVSENKQCITMSEISNAEWYHIKFMKLTIL